MARLFVVLMVVLLMGIPGIIFAEDVAPVEPEVTAEPEGVVDDWWGHLSARSGGLYNLDTGEWAPYVTVPILGYRLMTLEGGVEIDVDEKSEDHGPVACVIGLTYDLGNLQNMGIDVSWASYFGLNVGPYMRYDFAERSTDFGFMASVVDLSFDQGNVDRQKARKRQ